MQSNRSLLNVVMLAAAGAATSWLVNYWLDHRTQARSREKRELKEQIRTWEDEGGSLAPPVERRDLATH